MGQFTIENVQPGDYVLNVQLEGYFGPAVPGMPPAQQNVIRVNVTVIEGKTSEANVGLIPGGAIGGRVLDPRGRPVVDSPVQAMRVIYQADGSTQLQAFGNRPTDDRGDFRHYRLPPGEYYLVANGRVTAASLLAAESLAADVALAAQVQAAQQQARTFYPSSSGPGQATPLVITGGEEIAGANIQLRNTPLGKISGRVVHALPGDAFEPLVAQQRGQPAARGQATAPPALAQAVQQDPSLQPVLDEFMKAQAAAQEAQAIMQDARGRLQEARGAQQAALRGRGANQRVIPVAQLQLVPRDRNALVDPNTANRTLSIQLEAPNDGKFEMPNIPPGSYDLYASMPDNGAVNPLAAARGFAVAAAAAAGRSFGRVAVDVGEGDVSDITVTVRRGIDVIGRLIVDGRPVNFPNAHIQLQPDDSAARNNIYNQLAQAEAQVSPDGTFVFANVPEAAYRVKVTLGGPGPAQRQGALAGLPPEIIAEIQAEAQAGGNPQALLERARGLAAAQAAAQAPINAYVADVRQNSVSIYDTGLMIGSAPVNPIDVIVESNPGGIVGTVMGANQRPAANASVVLVPAPQRRRNADLFRTTVSGPDGKFTLNSLPPGEYKLFSWPLLNGTPYLNPAFMAIYEGRGTSVSILAGGALTAEVLLIPQ
jgi:hypothetical protein